MTGTLRITADQAAQIGNQALRLAGVPAEGARLQMQLLLEAQLRGRASHGLLRLPRVLERIRNGVADPVTQGRHEWRGNALLQVDGEQGLGPVVASNALRQISSRAKQTGVAVAAIRNNNHIGMLALYAEQVAADGQLLIALTTSEALVHPWGGRRAMIGTNPIAIGVPAQPRPYVFDMATSLVSMGQVHDYANRGQALEAGWALDANGDPTTDAAAARSGAIAPFGGAKGYALGLSFEVLVTALTASAIGDKVVGTLDATRACNKGDVFIVLEPAAGMAADVTAYLESLRASPPADPARPVVVPGDRAWMAREKSLLQGMEVPADVWRAISSYAEASSLEGEYK